MACLERPVLLRPGGLPRAQIEAALGYALRKPWRRATAVEDGVAPLAPGQLASHYAPRAGLRLDAERVAPGEALLAFGAVLPPGAADAARVLNLSTRGDLIEAAANLFSHCARSSADVSVIAVMPVPPHGLGKAINDRLQRGAGAARVILRVAVVSGFEPVDRCERPP